MNYGIKLRDVKEAVTSGLIITAGCGLLAGLVTLATGLLTGEWNLTPWPLVAAIAIAPVALILLLVGSIASYRLHIENGTIQCRFLSRFIVNEKKVEEIDAIKLTSHSGAAILTFRDQSTLRFENARCTEIKRLAADLQELTQGRIKVA